ncbi:MAG: prepilin-type N-terminal cleavage/methylation domain-containing protein [Sandaracinaceae bacterium]|nr:prepilin-type N-terminal cleavage/methylation domain-containing protein [Sandaracinaceae bacterium]
MSNENQNHDDPTTIRRARRRWRRHLRQEGMTLVEIMIVVIIMALIATGVAVAVLPQLESAKEDTTRTRAATIRSAATLFVAQSSRSQCPSVSDLRDQGFLQDGTDTTDGWGNEFTIRCERGSIVVVSDRYNGTDIIEATGN